MATPLPADRFLVALKNADVRLVEHGDWRTHNRNHKGPWGPVHGVVIHHTGPYSTEAGMIELCRTGYSGLPGPICHGVIDRSGTVHLVGYGRANHAGLGDDDVLASVIAEKALPAVNEANTDGNTRFYGFECINTGGGQTWPAAQLEAMKKVSAALCRAHGWNERSVIGHKEWQPGKPDPAGIDMNAFRHDVAKLICGVGAPASAYAPFPGAGFFHTGQRSSLIAAMGKRLVAEGCGRYVQGPGPNWTDADLHSYAAWQRKLGYSGAGADGVPGRATWDKLRVPNA